MQKDCVHCTWKPFDKDTCMLNGNKPCNEVLEDDCQFDRITDTKGFSKVIAVESASRELRESEQTKLF